MMKSFRGATYGLPLEEKLEIFIMRVTESGCWIWLGALSEKGYGHVNGKIAHRVNYEFHKGPIPDGLQLDHKCRVRCCVNPHHLEPVTLQVNVERGEVGIVNRSKTHCPNGHEYTKQNTGRYLNERYCKSCRSAHKKRYRARSKP